MNRREMIRTSVLTGAVAAALRPTLAAPQTPPPPSELTPAQSGVDASSEFNVPNWKPLFLDEHQNETLIILSDLIIPSTDTPGAKDALANRYIDLVLSAETSENKRAFLNSLAFIDGESIRRFKAAFRYLSRDDQDDVLHELAYPRSGSEWTGEADTKPDVGHAHFETLKGHIMTAYYSSEIGTTKELGWDGNYTHGVYQGCTHQEGNHK